ncbi:MAG: alginate export family protein, partial [Candidatus Brocadiales bacterium]
MTGKERSMSACSPPQTGKSKRWRKVFGSFVGAAVLALGISASTMASPDDEFVTQEDLKALKEEMKTLRNELNSIKAVKPAAAPAITGNVYSDLSRKIKIGGEIRARFESFYNFDFDGSPNDSHGESGHNEITLLRTRLNFDADVNDYLRAYLELQDNRAFGDEDDFHAGQGRKLGTELSLNPRGTMGNLGRVDLLQGYMELRSLAPVSPVLTDVSVLIGRWQMNYGGERLISEYDWSNQGRAFDGARIRYERETCWLDAFVTQIDEDFS